MKRLLSPRDLADAIGVSESSLKRWADAGRIQVVRTDGGHRRIPLAEAVRFIRDSGVAVVRPEILGFPDIAPEEPSRTPDDAEDALYQHLHAGDGRAARGLVMARYLGGEPVAALCDGPLRSALTRLGELWKHGDEGIFLEHRATDLCVQALAQIRGTLEPPPHAPVAVGGAPTGDPYLLPTFMAATVLAAEGYQSVNLGPETPVQAFEHAIVHHAPRLLWISISAEIEPDDALRYARLAEREAALGRAVIIGGRLRQQVPARPSVYSGASMSELAAFARGLGITSHREA